MSSVPIQRRHLRLVPALPSLADDEIPEPEPALTIDCDACEMQYTDQCGDCLVSYLVGHEEGTPVLLDEDEKQAVDLLTDAGLVPPSRFVHRSGIA